MISDLFAISDVHYLNPFTSTGLYHHNSLDRSISNSRVHCSFVCFFFFFFFFCCCFFFFVTYNYPFGRSQTKMGCLYDVHVNYLISLVCWEDYSQL